MTRLWTLLILFSCLPTLADMAVIGDSISVGSLTHPRMIWDVVKFQEYLSTNPSPSLEAYSTDFRDVIANPESGKIEPPVRHWEGLDEHKNPPLSKIAELPLRSSQVGKYIDIEENAWPYLLGRRLGYPAKEIQLTAESGNRSGDAQRQATRLLLRRKKQLPSEVFVFFAGNDLCGQNFDHEPAAEAEAWGQRVLEGVKRLIEDGIPAKEGTTLYVMPQLNPVDLIDSEEILNKKIYAFGAERTCREFRDFDPTQIDESAKIGTLMSLVLQYGLKSKNNLPAAVSECRSVLTIKKGLPDYEAKLARLRLFVASYEKAAEKIAEKARELLAEKRERPAIQVAYLKSPSELRAKAEYVANDCFHLSLRGQEELARMLIKEIKR